MTTTALVRKAGRNITKRRLSIELYVGLLLMTVVLVCALFGGWISPYNPGDASLSNSLLPPGTGHHLLGTNAVGNDMLGLVLAGFRWTGGVGLVATTIAAAVGTILGILPAVRPGILRRAFTGVINIGILLPVLVIAVTLMTVVGRGFWPMALVLGCVGWPTFARVVYGETLSIWERDYVLSARLMGVSTTRIVIRHVFPALRQTWLTMFAFMLAVMLIAEASLSFLGVGAPVGSPDWGLMLANSQTYLTTAPWTFAVPAGAIVLCVLAANLIGDGIHSTARLRARRGYSVE